MIEGNVFFEIAAILGLATVVGIVGQKLRQPLIIMFLATGILSGPSVLGIIKSYHEIELLAHIGVSLLLFIVGLKLDLNLIRTIGSVALATGLGQIVFTSIIGFFIALSLDMSYLSAAYVSVALTFSSTIIIVKLLSDKKEIDALHGQIAIGFLIVQDIAAILALVGLTTFGASVAAEGLIYVTAAIMIVKGIGFLGVVALLTKYVIPNLTGRIAYSSELLTLSAIAWAVLLGAGSELLGFSKEVGAFLAGVSLASTEYRDSIGARLTGLRDFLLLFFFIDLGARLDWSTVGSQINASIWLSLFVLIGNPLIVLIIMGFMGYRCRTGFLAGLTVAQISEFSLIVAALGLSIGHISIETMGLITLVGVVTIFISTYMILYSGRLYQLLAGSLKVFEKRNPYREAAMDTQMKPASTDIILAGLGNYGSGIAEHLLRRNKSVLGVDFDPSALEKWRKRGVPVIYGDVADQDMHSQLSLKKAQWFISAVRSKDINLALMQHLKKEGYGGKVALTAVNEDEVRAYEKAGANVILRPFTDATEQAADALTDAMDFLPDIPDWPISFIEVRIRSDALAAGRTIKDLPLRSMTGVSVLAVSRGGKVYYDPETDFRIYPGDRLLIMGHPDGLTDAEKVLNELDTKWDGGDSDRFEAGEIRVADNSTLSGRSLEELQFRRKYGVTLVGIRRGTEQITVGNPTERSRGGDCLIVVGVSGAVRTLKEREPL